MTYYILSLGCCKNRCDAEVMAARMRDAGYDLVQDPAQAEIILVNTCGFIESAKTEAVEMTLDMAQMKTDGICRLLGMTGCLSGRYGEELVELLPEVDFFLGTTQYGEIVSFVERALSGEKVCDCGIDETVAGCPERILSTPPWYAYLKIAEGCSNRCAFCAIPNIRGPFRSRPLEELIGEAQGLASQGVKELIVVAQDTTRYGEDLNGGKSLLPELLRRLCRIEGIEWIRFLYAYPERITEELLTLMEEEEKICPYLDIPMQHADDEVLRAMRRRSRRDQMERLMDRIRAMGKTVSVRTTMMVAFPGETRRAFENLLDFIEEHPFDHLGAFIFSPEEGTPAADMPGRPVRRTAQRRMEALMLTQQDISRRRLISHIGSTLTVLVEEEVEPGVYQGRSAYQAPDIDGITRFTSAEPLTLGDFVQVKITGSSEYDLTGEIA